MHTSLNIAGRPPALLSVFPGDAHDPDQTSDGGESSDGDVDQDEGERAASSSNRIVTSLNLDDVSSSSEEDEGAGESWGDGADGDDGDEGGDEEAATRGRGRGGKRVHWGEQEEGEREGEDAGGVGRGKRPRQQQANVFTGVAGEGVDVAASVEEQMMQLDEEDEKAKRSGGDVVGEGELRRAREALR